MRNELVS